MKTYLRRRTAALTLVLGFLAVSITAQTAPSKQEFPNIDIRNFGRMDTNYYRGAQPKKDDFKKLADLGITTVIDLRNDPTDYAKPAVEALGMKYINIPMDDAEYPSTESIEAFMKEINNADNGVMYVHCKGGKHRTGVTGAVYRFEKYGWDYDRTYREMKNYNFNTSWGRDVMKRFVVDYAAKMKNNQTTAAEAAGAAKAN